MPYNPEFQRYLSLRLKNYDYSTKGAYFVTICVGDRASIFGMVCDGQMQLNTTGRIAYDYWEELPRRFARVDIDHFIIMPNHMHGIIILNGDTPYDQKERKIVLGEVVRAYKAATTQIIRRSGLSSFAWQSNYYEHIIRLDNPKSLEKIRLYIEYNASKWEKDEFYRK